MFRQCARRFIGTAAVNPPSISVIKNPQYLQHRLALLGKNAEKAAAAAPVAQAAEATAACKEGPPKPHDNCTFKPLTPEEIKRFTTSLGSAEQLFNHQAGAIPTNVVDEETGQVIGSTQLNPTRYGDWEQHGRCCDF